MTSNIYSDNSSLGSLDALNAELAKFKEEKATQDALREASQAAAASDPSLSVVNDQGNLAGPQEMFTQIISNLARDPNGRFESYVKTALLQNPLIQQMNAAGRLPVSIDELTKSITSRAIQIQSGKDTYDPLYGDLSPEERVKPANRVEGDTFLNRTWEGILNAVGVNGRGDIEEALVDIDRKLSVYSPETKSGVAKLQLLQQTRQKLNQIKAQALGATSETERDLLLKSAQTLQDQINTLEKSFSDSEKSALEYYGDQYIHDKATRQNLKEVEAAYTPRYQSTVDKEMELAKLKQEYLAMGESASFTDPRSYWNGYARKWLGAHLEPETLLKDVAPEVVPWVIINGAIEAGAAVLTRGTSIPATAAKWLGMLGLGSISAYDAIDRNIDAYFEKHGTVGGFSVLQSNIMEGLAFMLDMYGGKLLSAGVPEAVDRAFRAFRKEALEEAAGVMSAGARVAEATGNPEGFKAAVKTAYELATGGKILDKVGQELIASGNKAAALYGTGRARQFAGKALEGFDIPYASRVIGKVGVTPLAKATRDSALGLAAENMMSETARQIGRQNGMDAEAIIESGMKGLVAGPVGRIAGKAVQVTGNTARIVRDVTRRDKEMLTPVEVKGMEHHVEEALKSDVKYQEDVYSAIKHKKDTLDTLVNEDTITKKTTDDTKSLVNKTQKNLNIEMPEESKEIYVNSKGEEVSADTKGAQKITTPDVDEFAIDSTQSEHDIKAKTEFNKKLRKIRAEAWAEKNYQESRAAQSEKLQGFLDKLKTSEGSKLTDEFIESKFTDKERADRKEELNKGHSDLANTTAEEWADSEKKEFSEYKDLTKEEVSFLNEAAGETDRTRDIVDTTQKLTDDEKAQLKEAIKNRDKDEINKLLAPKAEKAEEGEASAAEEETGFEAQAEALKGKKETKEGETEKTPEKPKEKINPYNISDEAWKAYQDHQKENPIDLKNFSESELRDKGILDSTPIKDFDALQKAIQREMNPEASKLAADAAAATGKPAPALPPEEQALQSQAQEVLKKIREFNAARKMKGSKKLDLTPEELKDVETEKVHTGSEEKEIFKKTKENEYDSLLKAASGAEKEFWNKEGVTKKQQDALLKEAQSTFKAPLFGGNKKAIEAIKNAKTLDDFVKAYNEFKPGKAARYLADNAANLYTKKEAALQKIRDKVIGNDFERVSESRGYMGFSQRTQLRNALRNAEAKAKAETEQSKEFIEQNDAGFLFSNTWDNKEFLNFVAYIIQNRILTKEGEPITSLDVSELKKKLATEDSFPDDVQRKAANSEVLWNAFKHLYRNPEADDKTYTINERWLYQAVLLQRALLQRANAGTNQNFKTLADFLDTVIKATQQFEDDRKLTIVNDQNRGLWVSSDKSLSLEEFADSANRAYRKAYANPAKFEQIHTLVRKALIDINGDLNKDIEVWSQYFDDVGKILHTADSKDLDEHLSRWIATHSIDADKDLTDLVESKLDDIWEVLGYWHSRDTRTGVPEAGGILEDIRSNSSSNSVKEFFSYGENKPGHVAPKTYWQDKWNLLEKNPDIKGKIINALLNNSVTLSVILGLPFEFKEEDLKDISGFGRIKRGLIDRLKLPSEWNALASVNNKNPHLSAMLVAYAMKANLIERTAAKEVIHEQFRKSLLNHLSNKALTPREEYHISQIDLLDGINTLRDFWDNIQNEREKIPYFVQNGYQIRVSVDYEETKENAKDAAEDAGGLIATNQWYKHVQAYRAAVRKAFGEANPDTIKAFRKKRITKEDLWKAQDKWAANNEKAIRDAFTGTDEEFNIGKQTTPPEEIKKAIKEARQTAKENTLVSVIVQYRKALSPNSLAYQQGQRWSEWEEASESNTGVISDKFGHPIASADADDLIELTPQRILETIVNKAYSVLTAQHYRDLYAKENAATRPDLSKLGLEVYEEQFLRNHFGELLVYKWLSETGTDIQRTSGEKFSKSIDKYYQEFNHIISYLNVTLPKYTDFRPITLKTVTSKDLNNFIEIASGTITRERLETLLNAQKNIDVTEFNLDNFFDNGKLIQPASYGAWINDKQQTAMAKALATFINDRQLPNIVNPDRNSISFTVEKDENGKPVNEQLNKKVHNQARLTNKDKFFKPGTAKSILLYADGFMNAIAQNPTLKDNEAFQLILEAARSLYGNIVIPKDDVFGDLECDYAGRVYSHVIDVAVTCGISTLVRTSSETSQDFLNQLKLVAPGAHDAYSNKENHLVDRTRFMESVGSAAARVLGYKKDTIAYKMAVARLGQIAVLGLDSLSRGGFFEAVYINKYTGKILPADAKDKADTIPAFQIADAETQQRLNAQMMSRDATGLMHNWTDKLLGIDLFGDQHCHTYEAKIKRDIKRFEEEWETEKNKQITLIDADGNINLSPLNDAWEQAKYIDDNGKEKTEKVFIARLPEMAVVAIADSKDKISSDNIVVMSHAALEKTDFTKVADHRLGILAAQALGQTRVDMRELVKTFISAGILKNDYTAAISIEEANQWSSNDLEQYLKKHPVLKMMLYTNSKYGMNPHSRSGKDRLNTLTTNLMDFRKMVADIHEFFNIDGNNFLQAYKDNPEANQYVKLYYNEMNTVNNRLFVKSNTFNYREDKHWRMVTSVNDLHEETFTLKDLSQQAQFAAPIMFNFGLDIDKIADAATLVNMWHDLCENKAFQRLMEQLKTADSYDEIFALISDYNEGVVTKDADGKITEKVELPKYTPAKGAPDSEGKYPKKSMKIEESFEALVTLSKLKDIKTGNNSRWIDGDYANLDNLTFTGYNILIEIDGLTNGPSIKNIASPLVSNTDYQSFLLLGATGASNRFFNIVDGYTNHKILDTYNLNGQFVKEDLTEDAIREFFAGSSQLQNIMRYLKTLYKPEITKGDEPLPPAFMDDIASVMNEVFDRNFMKPSTMVIGYEAGKASVIQTILTQLDRRFSEDCAKGNANAIKMWHESVMSLIGRQSIQAEYVVNGRVTFVTIDANGNVTLPGGPKNLKDFSPKELYNLSISHADILPLKERLSDTFGKVYDAIAKKKEVIQRPYKLLGECAQTLANTFDVIVRSAITKYIPKDGVINSDYVETVQKIIDQTYEGVNAIINVGIEPGTAKSKLALTKEEVADSVLKAIGVYTRTADGKHFVKTNAVLAGLTSLGAGTVPMFVHSYDSSIVHTMLGKLMDLVEERTLSIHDADLVSISQLAGKWNNQKAKDTIQGMNQGHYESGHRQIESFADICNNLTKAINTVTAKAAELGLDADIARNLYSELRQRREAMFKMVLNLASQRRQFYLKELGKNFTDRLYDFQYSAFTPNTSKDRALGGFTPQNSQLEQYIALLDKITENMIKPTDMLKMKSVLEETIRPKVQSQSAKGKKVNVFTKDGYFTDDVVKHLQSVESLVSYLVDIGVISETNKDAAIIELNKAIEAVNNSDPEFQKRNELLNGLKNSVIAGKEEKKTKNGKIRHVWSSKNGTVKEWQKDVKPAANRTESITRFVTFALHNLDLDGANLLITDNTNTMYTRAVDAAYSMSRLPDYLANSPLGFLFGLRYMTRANQSADQQNALQTLLTPFSKRALNINTYDKTKSGVIVYSDSHDYKELENRFSQYTQLQHNVNGEKDWTYYQNLQIWFNKIKQEMETILQNNSADQLIFTMRSDGDIWRILALQELIEKNQDAYGNRSIVIVPEVSNLSQASPAVNEEVAVYQRLQEGNSNISAYYITGTVPSHNVQLQQAVMGREISKASLSTGASNTFNPQILVMNDKFNGSTKVPISRLYRDGNGVIRRDELGDSIHDESTRVRDIYDSDLMTSGLHDKQRYNYNKNIAFDLDRAPVEQNKRISLESARAVMSKAVNASDSFEEILGNDNSTVVVETDASGSILHKGLSAYSKISGNTLYDAYQQYAKELAKKQHEYDISNHNEEDWKLFMTPVVVTVTNYLQQEKVFIFKPTIDNSISVSSLTESIDHRGMTMESARQPKVKAGSALASWLTHPEAPNTVHALESLFESSKGKSPSYRVIIPRDLIQESLLSSVSSLAPEWLNTHNAIYMNEIFAKLPSNQIRVPIDSIANYGSKDAVLYLPRTEKNIMFVNLHNIPIAQYEVLTKAQKAIQNMDVESRVSELTKEGKLSKVRSYLGNVGNAVIGRSNAHGYLGNVSDIPLEYKFDFATDNLLDYDKAADKFKQLMYRSINQDKANGIDTSLVEESLGLMENLVTLAYVRLNATDSITSSYQRTLLPDSVNEREFLNIGAARNGESQSEAFMHEMLHTLWRHLNAHNPALRKKLSDMYNYVSKNFTVNDFEDGLTVQNKSIMDAVFGKGTVDNVEEFLCYYLTNRAFHDAVNRMAERKGEKLSEVLESNTKGIFRKLLNSAQNLLKGTLGLEKEPDTIKGLAQKALHTALNYNNKYWTRKKDLIESATKEEMNNKLIFNLNDPTLKVIEKLYDDSVFTKAVQLAVQKIYKAFGAEDATAAYVSAHIGTTDEFNRITETGEQLADNLIEAKRDYLNAEDGFVNDLLSSLEGVSRSQYDYLILRTKSKAVIDQQREQLGAAVNEAVREVLKNVPEKIAKHLTLQFIRTDMSSLFRNTSLDFNQIKEVLTDKKARDAHIAELERTFASDRYANYYRNAAKGLAQYLVTGFNPTGLGYRNAYEILAKAGSPNQAPVQVGSAIYNALDQLISLYALDMLDTSKVNVFKSIPVETLNKLAVIHNAVKDSDNKEVYFDNNSMHLHVPKGELHGGTTSNRYEIIPEAELEAYEWNGYKKVSDAELDPFFRNHVKEKYVMVRAAYKSPAVTTAGIFTMTNIFKGRTKSGLSIGRSFNGQDITSKEFRSTQEFADLRAYIQARIENLNSDKPAMIQKQTSGNLLLNFNLANFLTGATFEVNPMDYLSQTGKEVHITSVLGDLYGSTIERTLTPKRNAVIAQSVISIYEDATDKENFVWVAPNSENEHYRELYDRLPTEVKEAAAEKYGERGLPVRLKALNTVFGYANLSANDTKKFIEEERKAQNNADKLASQFSICARNIFYNKYLGNAETLARWLAKVGKNQVVIKGLTTSWFNVLSNCVLLCMNGLSPKQMLEYQLDGLRQFDMLRQYKYQLRQLKQKQLAGTYTDADAAAESNINKSIKSLPIYALIENGVIANTIAEDRNETEALVQNAIKAIIPKGMLQTVANNFMITPNSYLYQILADFASLGDIGGKWALYRYNTERHLPPKEAARLSLNAFIDYSNPLPKQLQLVDDFAVLPFMKYAMGIQNNLARLAVKSPGRTLSWLFGLNTILDIAHPFQSLLSPQSVYDRMQLPGELFADSFGSLPSNRLLNWYGEVNP